MNAPDNKPQTSPHIIWTIGILVLAIIVLVTVKWSHYPNFVDRVNFAATLSSLILAVLAIAYAFYSNDSLANSLGRLEKSADTMAENNTRLDESLKLVSGRIAAVDDTLSKLSSKQHSAEAGPPQIQAPAGTVNALDVVKYFLAVSSWNGIKVIAACRLAHQQGKVLRLRNLCVNDTRMSFDYAYGYLVATASTGMFTYLEAPAEHFRINTFGELVKNELDAEIARRLNQTPADKAQKEQEIAAIPSSLM